VALVETLAPEARSTTDSPSRWRALLLDPQRHPWWCRLFLTLWCGLLFYHGLSIGQLWKTEGLRAIVAAQMLRSGNWIVPTLYGEPLFTKPPGMYVAIALASLPFGEVTEVTARLPSAIAATLTVLMLYGYFARCFGRLGGLVIAIVAPMSPLWLDRASAAEIDMMQVMWVTGGLLCFLRALEEEERKENRGQRTENRGQRTEDTSRAPNTRACMPTRALSSVLCPLSSVLRSWWLAALLCVAGGVLTKWTAPAFFYATVVPLLWWRGRLKLLLSWKHILAAAVGASICVAWIAAAVALEGWDVFYDTVKREALQRMVPSYSARPDPWYVALLHPARLWFVNLPWSLFALVACWPGFGHLWDQRGRRLWQALHCWIWPNMLMWSLMVDHKVRHGFPLFPGIAGLAALVWLAWLTGKLPWKWRWQPRQFLVTALVVWLVVKLVFVHAVVPGRLVDRDPRGKAAVLASLIPGGAVLYLFQIKDEGIMFYYGRPVLRLARPADLPSSPEPLYCILAEEEWRNWRDLSPRTVERLTSRRLTDEQGARIVLVCVVP
jgi:4-amino-4-deoxy-L-arabinose transferase-like glycosyltransferase